MRQSGAFPPMQARLVLLALAVWAVLLTVSWPVRSDDASDAYAALDADVDAAASVVVGVIHTAKPSKRPDLKIRTAVEVKPTQTLKGSPRATHHLTVDGGSLGLERQGSSKFPPDLTNGDRVLLLLDSSGALMPGRSVYRICSGDALSPDVCASGVTTSLTLTDVRGMV